jgi:hypothetical protein
MSLKSRLLRLAAGTAIFVLAVLAFQGSSLRPPPALAATGDLLQTVNVPAAAQCTSGLGTSVAVVPGSMLALNQYPILLVTSCFDTQTSSLFFLNPATNPATLVKTINTNPTPSDGWGSLSLRGDKGDLLGCGNNGATFPIYAIDISPFNAVPDGTATFLFNGAPSFDICDGVAWDAGDNTVYQSPDVHDTIFHYSEAGALLGSFPAPAGCPNSGLAVGGASLFAACNGVLTMYQVNKSTGATFTSFPTAGTRTEDLECDPVSFPGTDAMWSKDAFTDQIFAFEIPAGTCGFAGGPPVVPAQCPGGGALTDTDGDALPDCWENVGIDWDGDGTVDLQLYDVDGDGVIQPSEAADPNHKDMYVEIDYMAQHLPRNDAVGDVIAAFAAAPVANPDGTTGIRLHVQVDEQALAHSNNLAFEPCTGPGAPDFDTTKNASFGTAAERANANSVNILNSKRFMSRYSLWAHDLLGIPGVSGCAELPGNDHVVSLGSWPSHGNVRDHQAGTFMHEFGHTQNLRHGGGDDTNCKPNYLSVMSYSRQIDNTPIVGRILDYSPANLAALNEAAGLNEPAGIGGPAGRQTAFGPAAVVVVPASGAIDWNRNGVTTDVGVSADINSGFSGCGAGPGQNLQGFDDWANILYDFRATIDFADGVHLSAPSSDEITIDELVAGSPDSDGDGVVNVLDNCPLTANPGQADDNGNDVGDACESVDSVCIEPGGGSPAAFVVPGCRVVVVKDVNGCLIIGAGTAVKVVPDCVPCTSGGTNVLASISGADESTLIGTARCPSAASDAICTATIVAPPQHDKCRDDGQQSPGMLTCSALATVPEPPPYAGWYVTCKVDRMRGP